MKRVIALLFLAVLLLSMTGCSTMEDEFVGVWQSSENPDKYLIIYEDGSAIQREFGFSHDLSWTSSFDCIKVGFSSSSAWTYRISGDTLVEATPIFGADVQYTRVSSEAFRGA